MLSLLQKNFITLLKKPNFLSFWGPCLTEFEQDWRLFSPTLPENVVQGAAEPNTQMSAYPIFDKFGKLSGEKKNLEIGQDLTVLNQKHILLLHTQYLEDSTAPALN